MARGGFLSVDAADPHNPDKIIEALIPIETLQYYYRMRHPRWKNVERAKQVLESPSRIYHHVREISEGGWCYTGRPHSYWLKWDVEVPLPRHLLFAVYMNPGYHVYEWRLEKVDPDDPQAPLGWRERYGEESWRRDS